MEAGKRTYFKFGEGGMRIVRPPIGGHYGWLRAVPT